MSLSVENKPLFMYKGEEPMDESESYLINNRPITNELFSSDDRASLVLIENASELARRYIFDNNMLNKWGQQIAERFEKRWIGIVENDLTSDKKYKKKTLNPGDFGLIHNLIGGYDSHFGCFIVEEESIVLYDSMSNPENFKRFAEGLEKRYKVTLPFNFSFRTLEFQETGGFYGYLSSIDQRFLDKLPPKKAKEYELERINQSEESQNHFCYMWALFNILVHFTRTLDYNGDYGNPLELIKRFMYSLLAGEKVQKKKLFDKWFPAYWMTTNPYEESDKRYMLATIRLPKVTKNICTAFENTLN